MCRLAAKLLRSLALTVAVIVPAVAIVVVIGMRTKCRPVLDAVRRFNKAVGNPRQMATAGTPGAYASIIRHVGRSSGRTYETPVTAIPTDDGFVVVLPYGTSSDWLQNVLAAGAATVLHEGTTHDVERPELQPIAAARPWVSTKEDRIHRLFGVEQCLVMRHAA